MDGLLWGHRFSPFPLYYVYYFGSLVLKISLRTIGHEMCIIKLCKLINIICKC